MTQETKKPPVAGTTEGHEQQNTSQANTGMAPRQGLVPRDAVKTLDLSKVGDRINILGPRNVVYAGEGMQLRAVEVRLSANPNDADVYPAIGRSGELSIGKIGLLKLASAKGVIWSPRDSGFVQDASPCAACVERALQMNRQPICPHNIGYRAVGAWLDPTGAWEVHTATKYWSWDEELEEVRRVYRKQLESGRITAQVFDQKVQDEFQKRFRDRFALAETKAKLRVIREIGVKPTYTPAELNKGFLAMRVEPDLSRTQAQARGMASANQVFGGFGQPPTPDAGGPDFNNPHQLSDEAEEPQPVVAPLSDAAPSPEPEQGSGPETPTEPETPAPPAAIDFRQTGVKYECWKCGQNTMKYVPAGVSKTTGKKYGEFWKCQNPDCTGGKNGGAWVSYDYSKDMMVAFNGGEA